MILSNDLPAGNIRVLEEKDKRFTLDVEMRDSSGDWFYWKFKALFPEPGIYHFHFAKAPKIGTLGPAVSLDRGRTWHWQRNSPWADAGDFSFECREPGEVWFCQAIPYLQGEFDAFAEEFRNHPAFHLSTLCKSRKGRKVELVTVRGGNPKLAILLTSRHHAQEMMATHAMEGILRAVLGDTEFGRAFREKIALYAVPFVDKDGVEDGDQGKNRRPHDHARDYTGDCSIYPECAAIRRIVDGEKPFFILDMHCPWLRGGATNEEIYMVGGSDVRHTVEMNRFGAIFEQESPADAPYFRKNDIPFGTLWNTAENFRDGLTLAHYGDKRGFVNFVQAIEIPFANFGEHPVDRESMLRCGAALARSILRYAAELEALEK